MCVGYVQEVLIYIYVFCLLYIIIVMILFNILYFSGILSIQFYKVLNDQEYMIFVKKKGKYSFDLEEKCLSFIFYDLCKYLQTY